MLTPYNLSPSTHASHSAPFPPCQAQFCSPSTHLHLRPARALAFALHTFQVDAGDSWGFRRRMLALSVRARCDGLNGTIHGVYRCLLGIRLASRMLKTRCSRPISRPLCPDRGTAEPSCTPPTCTCAACSPSTRASAIASRTHPARPGPLPRPEHARTHVPPQGASHRPCTRLRSRPATNGV